MKMRFFGYLCTMIIASSFFVLGGCSTTQKTEGAGMVSAVVQNVVRIAGISAMKTADFSSIKAKKVHVKTTGFADDFNKGFVEHLVRTKVEDSGAFLSSEAEADAIIEAAINNAGNDLARSKVPLVSSSERSEGTVNLTITIRDAHSGRRVSSQNCIGYAKYEQGEFLGVPGSGQYFVKENGSYVLVPDPTAYK